MDARAARDECHARGRLNRMVLTPRRWRQVIRSVMSALAGPARRMSPITTGANKPGTPGRVRHRPLKPIAQGRPACSGVPVVTCLRAFLLARKATGAIRASGLPCALRFFRGSKIFMQNPGTLCRGNAEVCLSVVIPGCAFGASRNDGAGCLTDAYGGARGRRESCFPSPLVGEGGSPVRSSGETDEGSVSAERDPSSAFAFREGTFSHKGRRHN